MIPIPLTHGDRILRVPGVKRVAATVGFGGVLPARREGKAADRTAPSRLDDALPEPRRRGGAVLRHEPGARGAPDEFRDFLSDLRGCVIGRQLAEKFGWKIGDRFFLQSFVAGMRKKSGPFEFVVRGFIDTDPRHPGTETDLMFFHLKYLSEGLGGTTGHALLPRGDRRPGRARPRSPPRSTPCSRTPATRPHGDRERVHRRLHLHGRRPGRARERRRPGGVLQHPARHREHHEHGRARAAHGDRHPEDARLRRRAGDGTGRERGAADGGRGRCLRHRRHAVDASGLEPRPRPDASRDRAPRAAPGGGARGAWESPSASAWPPASCPPGAPTAPGSRRC